MISYLLSLTHFVLCVGGWGCRLGPAAHKLISAAIEARWGGEQPVGTAMVLESGCAATPFLIHAPCYGKGGGGADTAYFAMTAVMQAVLEHNAWAIGDSDGTFLRSIRDLSCTLSQPELTGIYHIYFRVVQQV